MNCECDDFKLLDEMYCDLYYIMVNIKSYERGDDEALPCIEEYASHLVALARGIYLDD